VKRTIVLPTELVVRESCGCVNESDARASLGNWFTLGKEVGLSMRMLARRLLLYIVTAWVAITANFLLPRMMPGNPIRR